MYRFNKNSISSEHLMFVHPSGIIRYWAPLFRSESPSQVSLIIIKYLALFIYIYKTVILSTFFLFYDNMCNIERLKLWTCDLENLSPEAKLGISVYQRINRGVDALHISNHVRESCKKRLSVNHERL